MDNKSVDTKTPLRIVWIVEGVLLFIMTFAILLFTKRTTQLIELMPYLFGLIALQATGAIGGASLKRLTEGYKIKAEKKPR